MDELTQQNVDTIAAMERSSQESRTFGERCADGFARIVGSWPFIIAQSVLLTVWITLNVVGYMRHWDPYPFILLNLALSFQAAYATPIIMMSQNRDARLAERRNHLDLQINLLAEQETTEILCLLRKLCDHQGVTLGDRPAIEALAQQIKPQHVVAQIEKTVEQVDRKKQGEEPIDHRFAPGHPDHQRADGGRANGQRQQGADGAQRRGQ
jgi:uncharacterized membrane protein